MLNLINILNYFLMKKFILFAFLLVSFGAFAQTEKIYYCVQVCSTENPHLLKPEMVSIIPMDTAMVETVTVNGKKMSRILFVYETEDDQMVYHTSWLKQWHDAMMVTRTASQVAKLRKLFTYE